MIEKKINIVYFSGTGGTKMVAEHFSVEFLNLGYDVNIGQIFGKHSVTLYKNAPIILLYPVYACNAPLIVHRWLKSIENVKDINAAVVSVSGGGEVIPNTACRVRIIKKLQEKGYNVIYEDMVAMPSNCFVNTEKTLAKMLLEVLPLKVKSIANDIKNGVVKRTKPFLIDRALSGIFGFQKYAVKMLGRQIKCLDTCNGCGWCAKNCPTENIEIKDTKPQFSSKCNWCLACIYGCPKKALTPKIAKFFIINNGYNLMDIKNSEISTKDVDVDKLAKGYLWSGVKKYLNENNK